ncbi:MAG: hypothetical protein JJU05_05205 [Verrucomicrobia bacterium]|nr:hypothetical protein [Verrucomicrobiota bacterium]MCH8525809.1 hypothetical protein [Kiritimatiellia bacterium]
MLILWRPELKREHHFLPGVGGLWLAVVLALLLMWILPVGGLRLLFALPLGLYGIYVSRAVPRIAPPLILLLLGLLLALLAIQTPSPWFFFLRWTSGGMRSGLFRLLLLWLLLGGLLAWRKASPCVWGLPVMALLLSAACLRAALRTLGGVPLYRTDHPSFMYRLWELGQSFPALGGYNPSWNAGTEHYAGVASGVQGLGLLVLPLLRHVPVHELYNPLVLVTFILATPLICALSVRAVGGRPAAMAAAAILSLAVSHPFFQWMWHFGTLGAAFSAVMVVPTLALAYRAAILHRLDPVTFLCLGISVFLMSMWGPLVPTMGGGLLLAYLWMPSRWTRRSFVFLLSCAVLSLLAFWPWIRVLLFPARFVVDYVNQSSVSETGLGTKFLEGGRRLGEHLASGHPLLLFLGMGGAVAGAPRSVRRWYVPPLLLSALVCGWGLAWRPYAQLERLGIPLLFAAIVPAALCTERILRNRSPRSIPARAGLLAVLLLGGYTGTQLYANRGPAPAQTMDPVVGELVDWIRAELPDNGRLLFAGRAVHAYGGGKIAYLPVLSGREMMADDYYGFPPGTVEFNYPPVPYRRSLEAFQDFAAAYNVTHVITSHDSFREFFAAHPGEITSLAQFEFRGVELTAYRLLRKRPLLPEQGRVTAGINRLVLQIDTPQESVVLPYNWREGLHSQTPGATVEPYAYDGNIRLIRVRPGGAREVVIGYQMPWGPVAPNFDGRFHH